MQKYGCTAIMLLVLAPAVRSAYASGPPQSPQQLIKDVVFNELTDHRRHGYFEYRDLKRVGEQTILAEEVETSTGKIHRKLAEGDRPLTTEQQGEETHRLQALLHDSGLQQRLLRDYQGDEDRIARILGLLPEGFLYSYDGAEGGEVRLKYRPNPDFKPPTYEARVFHGMAGTVWIDAREKRLVRLDGQLVSNVDFGYGLLGRLDKGGTFSMERIEVTPNTWKTRTLDVHITGHVILLKSIGKDQTERRWEFREVPANLTLQEAEAMLSKSAGIEARLPRPGGAEPIVTAQPVGLPVAMALK